MAIGWLTLMIGPLYEIYAVVFVMPVKAFGMFKRVDAATECVCGVAASTAQSGPQATRLSPTSISCVRGRPQ